MHKQTKQYFIILRSYKSFITLCNVFNSQMCLNGFLPLFFFLKKFLQQVSFRSVIYLHIRQTNINSSNVAEVPIALISNLSTLVPINDIKRVKRKSFLLLIAQHTIQKTDYNIPNQLLLSIARFSNDEKN